MYETEYFNFIQDMECEYFTWCHIASVQGCNKLIMKYMTLSESVE